MCKVNKPYTFFMFRLNKMNKTEKDLNISILADIYGKLITKRQLEILRDYYDYDSSLAEIAEKYGIARQSVKDSLSAARESLLNFEDKLKLNIRFSLINQNIDALLRGDLTIEQTKEILNNIKFSITE